MTSSMTVQPSLDVVNKIVMTNLDNGLRAMSDTVLNDSRMRAPKLTGALRSDGTVEKVSTMHYSVKYGDSRVPYARLRHYVNNKNPQTKYYLQDAGDKVAKEGLKRFL